MVGTTGVGFRRVSRSSRRVLPGRPRDEPAFAVDRARSTLGEDGVGTVALNRPERLNAMNRQPSTT